MLHHFVHFWDALDYYTSTLPMIIFRLLSVTVSPVQLMD
uniref:Uncharacterized protein n=1 Tax=Arundo donax TaxID=35708 RepID=A0A0A9B937_ARUDO